jgi:signal transduction histidine kinase
VTVILQESEDGYFVRISDNGAGFSAGNASQPTPGHFGLAAMHERAKLAGGWLRVEREPGQGTTVEVWAPRSLEPAGRPPQPA